MTSNPSSRQTSGLKAVTWWMAWIAVTIVSFFVSCWFWTGFLARNYGTMDKPGAPILWVTAVFGTWMILLVPLIVVMYAKVDKAYEDARINREGSAYDKTRRAMGVRCLDIPQRDRRLSESHRRQLRRIPQTIRNGHLVSLVLQGGRTVRYAFILNGAELAGVYAESDPRVLASQIEEILPVPAGEIPDFEASGWVRLDGVGVPWDEKTAV